MEQLIFYEDLYQYPKAQLKLKVERKKKVKCDMAKEMDQLDAELIKTDEKLSEIAKQL